MDKKETWEERFDEEYKDTWLLDYTHFNNFKAFVSQEIAKAKEETIEEIYTQVSEKIGENIDKTLEVSAISGIDSATLFLKNFRSLQHALYQWDKKGCGDQLKSEEGKWTSKIGYSLLPERRKLESEHDKSEERGKIDPKKCGCVKICYTNLARRETLCACKHGIIKEEKNDTND